jgi:hypothetical protein
LGSHGVRTPARSDVDQREQEVEHHASDEHRAGVQDVLARRTPVNVPGRLFPDRFLERADEGFDRVAGSSAGLADRRRVECFRAARGRDGFGGGGRDQPGARGGRSKCGFRIQQRLEPRHVRRRFAKFSGHEQLVEHLRP